MSSGSIGPIIAASTVATMAAAAKARKQRVEEEKMTAYNKNDLDGWEFKIVRANTRRFKNRTLVENVRTEEAKAGWELVEKFDNYRLRFKRRVEKRSMDGHLEIDPYRSQIGSSSGMTISVIVSLLITFLGFLVFIGFKFGFDRGLIGGLTMPGLIIGLLVVFGAVGAIISIRKNK